MSSRGPSRRLFPIRLLAALTAALVLFSVASAATASAAPTLGLMNTGSTNWAESKAGPTESAEEWAAIGKSGAETFRMPIEPDQSANGTNWAFYDKVFRLADENGVSIQPFLSTHGGAKGLPFGTEKEKEEWFIWVKKAVKRYGYNGSFWAANPGLPARPVTAWEVWNEPDNAGIAAETYGAFLVYTAAAIQFASEEQAAVKTGVIFGGLLIVNNTFGYQSYLKNAWKVPGVSSSIVGVGIHPYELGIANPIGNFEASVKGVRTYLNTLAGGGTKSLWLTEMGWPLRSEYAVSEATQAELLTQAFNWVIAQAGALNIQNATWYNYRDSDFQAGWQWGCGLRDEVGNFRKSWFAFQAVAKKPRWPVTREAMQANTGTLFTGSQAGAINTGAAMKAGTSPSIGQYRGSYKAAFQGSNGNLFMYTPSGGSVNTGYGMKAGTNPSITPLEDGVIAFQGNTGTLWTYESGGPVVNTGYAMAAGTSPSITVVPDLYWRFPARYPVAFQSNTGALWVYEEGVGLLKTELGMAPGTSPVVVALDSPGHRYAVLFQANTGAMWIYEPFGTVASTGYGMAAGTSPGATSLSGGKWAGSFQANTGQLWLYEPGGTVASTGLGMQSGSSPSESAISEYPYYRPYEIAFFANTSQLWTYEPGGAIVNGLLGSAANTSPAVAPG
jgi:hypothetical protein